MNSLPGCPACASTLTYQDGALFICPECSHEWSSQAAAPVGDADSDALVVRDSVGNLLADGDTVTVIKDLKVKGSSTVVKVGTKVKGIRLVAGDHDIDCRIEGIGPMGLKSEFVKKV
jgi:protein PhnA